MVNLTWDLFVLVFFAVVIAYSFIIGRNQTLKVVISTYIAILAADGAGNLINHLFIGEDPLIRAVDVPDQAVSLILVKIFIFVLTLVLIVMKGSFAIQIAQTKSTAMNMVLNLAYGVLSAGLIVSTILIYIGGISLFDAPGVQMSEAMRGIYDQSYMVRQILDHGNVWFFLPALTFVIASFMGDEA